MEGPVEGGDKVRAALDRVEAEQAAVRLEPNENSLDLMRKVYHNNSLPLHTRIRCGMAALPHEVPKLGVTVNVNDDGSFAAQLQRAIDRSSNGIKQIEGSPLHEGLSPIGLSENPNQSEAQTVSAEHQRRPILPKLTRRV